MKFISIGLNLVSLMQATRNYHQKKKKVFWERQKKVRFEGGKDERSLKIVIWGATKEKFILFYWVFLKEFQSLILVGLRNFSDLQV